MLVFRIIPKSFSSSLLAPGVAGRWNGDGRKVVYTAESIPLAFMENMIRRKGIGFHDHFAIMLIEVPDILSITTVDPSSLETNWRDFADYSICQAIGNKWYDKGDTPVLKVPSAVIPTNYNYVLNSIHPEFSKIKLVGTSPLIPDDRIEDLLRKYK